MRIPPIPGAGQIGALYSLLQTSLRLEREQWLSPAELAARREVRLQKLLAKAAAAPYYRATLRKAGITDARAVTLRDLHRLPLLDRHVITKHGLDAFLTADRSELFTVRTSGSTGTPGIFMRSKEEETEYSARWWRVYSAFGCSMWDAQICVAVLVKPDRAGPITLMRRMGVLPRVERMASDAPPAQVLERVREMNPPILTGYAGAIEALADQHGREGGAAAGRVLHRDGSDRSLHGAGGAGLPRAGGGRVRHQRMRRHRVVLPQAPRCAPHGRRQLRHRGARRRRPSGA
jgi:phenylacetate-coenzyme A ligase PaaK-like adenylate-forming protein